MMTLKEVLKKGTAILENANIETPALDAGVIMCYVLNCDRVYLHTHGDRALTEVEIGAFIECVYKRAKNMPVSYITGYREFMSLNFKVNPHVLIPRPETELLVEWAVKYADELRTRKDYGGKNISILDIGTGSGCIAVSLAYYIADCRVVAVDVSDRALEVAGFNAANIGVPEKVELLKSDLFSRLDRQKSKYRFDIIVSNPPYIPQEQIGTLQREVAGYEPLSALAGGMDGLDFYRNIADKACEYLKPYGMLAFEVGYNQAGAVCSIMEKKFCDLHVIRDLSGIDRVVSGRTRQQDKN